MLGLKKKGEVCGHADLSPSQKIELSIGTEHLAHCRLQLLRGDDFQSRLIQGIFDSLTGDTGVVLDVLADEVAPLIRIRKCDGAPVLRGVSFFVSHEWPLRRKRS